jgi:UDP-N-acetylmuramate dehydrogenase
MQIQNNISLKDYNTFGIDVKAKYFSSFKSLAELKELGAENKRLNDLLILGGGSNILFTKDVDGLVLKNELKGIELVKDNEAFFYVKAAA